MVYGRYNELDNYMVFMGFINQRSHHWEGPILLGH